jgi:hypothetical protein
VGGSKVEPAWQMGRQVLEPEAEVAVDHDFHIKIGGPGAGSIVDDSTSSS